MATPNPNDARLATILAIVAQVKDPEASESRAKSDGLALAGLVADLNYSMTHGGTVPTAWGGGAQ